ncbi:MAG: endolytic transglycosylase MltG, partial [Candidatus Limnocylindrales bacterium]
YQDRLNPKLFPLDALQSDPTVFYVNDTLQLASLPFDQWRTYLFWAPLAKGTTLPASLPDDLAGYNTYTSKGLIPGPICTPSVASIKAALAPDTSHGYLYFLATKDGTTVYAKTYAQHLANIAKYGS